MAHIAGDRLFPALVIGSAGTLILGLQPILLGALLSEARVTFDGLALMATVEMLAIGIGSAMFALLFSANRMRLKAGILLLAVAGGQIATGWADGLAALSILRLLTGLVEGALIAVAVEAVARTTSPGRNGGWFVVIQTLGQSVLAGILALLVVPLWGSAGGFVALGLASLATLAAVPLLADDYGPLDTGNAGLPRIEGWLRPILALSVIFTLYLFIGAIWAFLEPLGGNSGIAPATVGLIVSVSLLVQVAGALAGTAFEPRLPFPLAIGGVAIAATMVGAGFSTGPGEAMFWTLSLATGFLWLFVVPWQISMTVHADPSRKTALLVPAAQLFGAALGPAGAAAFITGNNYLPVGWFAAMAAALSFALLLILLVIGRGRNRNS